MPANVDLDDVDLNENRNGGKRVPAWEKFMRANGASEEDILEARRDAQSDFTRARQKDTQRMDRLEQQLQQVQRGNVQQPQGGNQKLPWDVVLEKHGLDKNAPQLKEMLQEYGNAIAQSVLQASQGLARQEFAPVAQTLQQQRMQGERAMLAKRFGEKRIDALWPDIEAEANARLQRGEGFRSVEDVFREAFPDDHADAFFEAESARRRSQAETNKTKSDEGFITPRRSQPMQIADSRQSAEEAPDLEKIGQDAVQEAMKELGITK